MIRRPAVFLENVGLARGPICTWPPDRVCDGIGGGDLAEGVLLEKAGEEVQGALAEGQAGMVEQRHCGPEHPWGGRQGGAASPFSALAS